MGRCQRHRSASHPDTFTALRIHNSTRRVVYRNNKYICTDIRIGMSHPHRYIRGTHMSRLTRFQVRNSLKAERPLSDILRFKSCFFSPPTSCQIHSSLPLSLIIRVCRLYLTTDAENYISSFSTLGNVETVLIIWSALVSDP